MHIKFEFDAAKSVANKIKHGVDFDEAQSLWLDPTLLEAPARTHDEPRFLAVGTINGKHWSAIFTRRGDKTRLISVRRSRQEEIARYES
jgi:uncharacterized protein